jgi:hypothetical protein
MNEEKVSDAVGQVTKKLTYSVTTYFIQKSRPNSLAQLKCRAMKGNVGFEHSSKVALKL